MTEKKLINIPMTELPMDLVQAVAEGRAKLLHEMQVRVMASMLLARERQLNMTANISFYTYPTGTTNVSYCDAVVAQIYRTHSLRNNFSVWSADGQTPLGNNFRDFSEAVKFVTKLLQEGKIG